jgi:hypothetical protein
VYICRIWGIAAFEMHRMDLNTRTAVGRDQNVRAEALATRLSLLRKQIALQRQVWPGAHATLPPGCNGLMG